MKSTNNPSVTQAAKGIDSEEYDLVILGGGTGATIAAWTFATEGKRVAVIDRRYIGGSIRHPPVFRSQQQPKA
jgi:ribulose 1,5-bisphosphate synthetase/thiazole synthase